MEDRIAKSATQIKDRIEFWFCSYFRKTKSDLTGKEIFTLFELIDEQLQTTLSRRLSLSNIEIPVLILKISDSEFIVNTSCRFVRITASRIETVAYSEFAEHRGFHSFALYSKKYLSIKEEGYFSQFGLEKRNGEVLWWKIPTGEAGFGFWNVTKKCELIGRKFKQVD